MIRPVLPTDFLDTVVGILQDDHLEVIVAIHEGQDDFVVITVAVQVTDVYGDVPHVTPGMGGARPPGQVFDPAIGLAI